MAIGLTKYSGKKFAIINFISALFWASVTIIPAYYYGAEILKVLQWIKAHWYFAVPLILLVVGAIVQTIKRIEKNLLEKRRERRTI
jgi:membrane protein DedA with SNARE-associated domain